MKFNYFFEFLCLPFSLIFTGNDFMSSHKSDITRNNKYLIESPKLLSKGSSDIYINEVMASNSKTIVDEDGNSSDWIEIYNSGSIDFDLAGYYITDDFNKKTKFKFAETPGLIVVPANGYKIIWASGKEKSGHTTWSLSASGEDIYLIEPDGETIVDGFSFPAQRTDVSYGRLSGNLDSLVFFSPSSPGLVNQSGNAYKGFLNPPVFSKKGGVYSSDFSLDINGKAGEVIYYTLDSSEPDPSNTSGSSFQYKNEYKSGSLLTETYKTYNYSGSIYVTDRSDQNNSVSIKASSAQESSSHNYFPSSKIKKGTIVRAIATKAGYLSSDIVTESYFVFSNPDRYSMPIHSIVIPEKDLFDYYDGFYTPGIHYDTLSPSQQHYYCPRGNYFLKELFEKAGNFEYFVNKEKKVGVSAMYKIHGGCSTQNPKKSLRFKTSDKIDYPFFNEMPDNRYDRIVIRNAGNEDNMSMVRDVFYADISRKLNFEYMDIVPSISFLNGEYWGISYIRERVHRNYIQERTGVSSNSIDLVEFNGGDIDLKEGTLDNYNSLISFINSYPLSNTANYELFTDMVDESSLIDYTIAEIFSANTDWPQSNLRMWRANRDLIPGEKFYDGKWRWILFDIDYALGFDNAHKGYNSLSQVLSSSAANTIIFRKAFQSPIFKAKVFNRLNDLLNTHYLYDRTKDVLQEWKDILNPEINEHIARWSRPHNVNWWLNDFEIIRDFLEYRADNVRSHFQSEFSISGVYNLTVVSSDTTKGTSQVNSIIINTTTPGVPADYKSWTGKYFKNVSIELRPRPKYGYKFSYWEKDGGTKIYDSVLVVTPSSNVGYTVYFEEAPVSENPVPEAYSSLMDGCKYILNEWSDAQPSGSYPYGARFVYFEDEDPKANSKVAGFTAGGFDATGSTRISGKNELGISFINAGGSKNEGYPGTKIGGMILALNTMNLDAVTISWTGRTHTLNKQPYGIRMQYREADMEDPASSVSNFLDFSPIVNYPRGENVDDSTRFSVSLPNSLLNKPYIQILWRYYRTDTNPEITGARDELGIDDIEISGMKTVVSHTYGVVETIENPQYIYSNAKIEGSESKVNYSSSNAIILEPGFKVSNKSQFKAEIKLCDQ